MEKNSWKVLAIVFIVVSAFLLIALVIESLFLFAIIMIESDLEQKEVMCDTDICGGFEDYRSYRFDESDETCSCYDGEGELLHREFVELW